MDETIKREEYHIQAVGNFWPGKKQMNRNTSWMHRIKKLGKLH